MSKRELTVEGKRVYIKTEYGDPIVQALKNLGAHWEPESKRWWIGSSKKAEVEALLTKSPETSQPIQEDPDQIKLVGKAKYKGKTYYVRWVGETKSGEYKARMISLDQKLDFWVKCARFNETASEDMAQMVKTYSTRTVGQGKWAKEVHTTLGGIKKFLEQQKNPETRRGECSECGSWGTSGELCEECHEGYFG